MSTQQYRVRSGADLGRVLRDARSLHGLTQQQLVDQLTDLIGIFENPVLDFSKNWAEAGESFEDIARRLSSFRADEGGLWTIEIEREGYAATRIFAPDERAGMPHRERALSKKSEHIIR